MRCSNIRRTSSQWCCYPEATPYEFLSAMEIEARAATKRNSKQRYSGASTFTPNDLRQIAKMSARNDGPCRAIDALTKKGICVVVMPALPGTFLDGAAIVSVSGAPVVGLTLRHDRIDNFWFTLLHELAHICLHFQILLDTRTAFVDDMEIRSEDAREQEADKLAQELLIPKKILSQVVWSSASVHDDLVAVATRAESASRRCRWQMAARSPELQEVFATDRPEFRQIIAGPELQTPNIRRCVREERIC